MKGLSVALSLVLLLLAHHLASRMKRTGTLPKDPRAHPEATSGRASQASKYTTYAL